MCGIGGVMLFPKNRSPYEMNFIRLLAEGIMIENEARGKDSAGMVAFGDKGYNLIKEPINASKLALTADFRSFMTNQINQGTKNILIHTRLATQGSKMINDNNHPIDTYSCVGVHNGVIYNDDELFKEHNLFRQAQVDSEAIFRMIDAQGRKLNANKVKKVAESLSGMFATAFVRKNQPHKMWVVRNDNPITMMFIPQLNLIAFASQKTFLIDALNDANYQSTYNDFISKEDCLFMEPTKTSIYEFDVSQDTGAEQLFQEPVRFEESDNYWSSNKYYAKAYGYDWWDDYDYASESKDAKKNKEEGILSLLNSILTEEQLEQLEDEFEIVRARAWSEGYKDGRESLAEQIEHVKSGAKHLA